MSETRATYRAEDDAGDEAGDGVGFICLADGMQPLDFVAACLRSEATRRAREMGMSDPDGYARWLLAWYGMDGYLSAAEVVNGRTHDKEAAK